MAYCSEDTSAEKRSRSDSLCGDAVLFEDEVKCASPTGINVLIVGGGLAGLSAALECHRKGHSVRLLDRSSQSSAQGKTPQDLPSGTSIHVLTDCAR